MKKTIFMLAGLASMLAVVPAAQAAAVAGNFNVTVTLTSVCTMGNVGNLDFGTYTAFQTTAKAATTTTATLSCTRGMTGIAAAFDSAAASVVAGLQYSIAATPGIVSAGAAATTASIGESDSRPFVISGNMPAGQAGDASASASTPQLRTLTITY